MLSNSALLGKPLLEIAGNTEYAGVRILRSGKIIRFQKAYKVKLFIHRYDKSEPVAVGIGVYNPAKQRFDVKIPSSVTDDLYGNYHYQIELITPTGQHIRKWCGYQSEIPHIGIPQFIGTIMLKVRIDGSHPNPIPHIRSAIKTEYFEYKTPFGVVDKTITAGISDCEIAVNFSSQHSPDTTLVNIPLPFEFGLFQNYIEYHSTTNSITVAIVENGIERNVYSKSWTDDAIINSDTANTPGGLINYTPTYILRVTQNEQKQLIFEDLI